MDVSDIFHLFSIGIRSINNYCFNKINSMKTRSESEPKLKAVYTSRIKDGRYSNEQSPMKNNFMTAQKPTYNDHKYIHSYS